MTWFSDLYLKCFFLFFFTKIELYFLGKSIQRCTERQVMFTTTHPCSSPNFYSFINQATSEPTCQKLLPQPVLPLLLTVAFSVTKDMHRKNKCTFEETN